MDAAFKRHENLFFEFTLYISGISRNSAKAIENMKKICEEHLKGRYKLKIVDLANHPEKQKLQQVLALPTLIKELPTPVQKMIGDLSNTQKVMISLEIV